MYIVSSCLAGINCRYDGGNNLNEKVIKLVKEGKAIPVCPEMLGGLKIPRVPAEIVKNEDGKRKVINKNGEDVTTEFIKGAMKTVAIAKILEADKAVMKKNSPSCGYGKIYDGTFSNSLVEGNGITIELLIENGVEIITVDDLA
ncbi:DUF523 domain-containing protein [Halanaerobium congolense]|jgi:uncharacterized protein YbbK (DUF523 family)|uniref:DUF523 domain-containing protein n=1 Tax=Halanaerobium congolense TaxID=54121 RepID=UPI0008803C02|nr:DUF523 domain-containing protein [Halanaerobium congolense]SDH12264.1 Uncharacterized conserved protein YbbK, DUF523 family [Halanaerobium congolense]SHN08214.1 Uncharacterized conserved protein YbbK, DUF523 family [Halanaerobium congolense]